jgi:hypothetical protein
MSLNNKYNTDDVFSRAISAGLLRVLNSIKYTQTWSNNDIEEIDVPFFYNSSGDERFKQDFFTFYGISCGPKPIDGQFDRIPRGSLTYTGSPISAQRITSRFVQGKYIREVNGKLQTFSSFLYSIPLSPTFACEIWSDTYTTALKIEQAIRETFYKTVTYYVYFRGMRVGCTIGFPETIGIEKNINYSFESDNKIKITFDLEGETYQPVFDPTTEQDANNYMRGIGFRLYDNDEKNDGNIWVTSPSEGTTLPKGLPIMIDFNYKNEGAVINRVDAFWANTGETEWNSIERMVPNHMFYIWDIPNDFTSFKDPQIIYEEDSSMSIYRSPVIRVLPDVCTNEINSNSFHVLDEGYFLTPIPDTSIGVILEMRDDQDRVSYTGDNAISLNITGYKIDSNNLIAHLDACIYFPGTVNYKVVDIIIANSVNNEVFGKVENIIVI